MKKIEAVVLKKTPLYEADEIVSLYSKENGRVEFKARGIKKSSAKHSGTLQTFNLLNVWFIEGRGRPVIIDTQLKESFAKTKASLAKTKALSRVLNVISSSTPRGGADYILWQQLADYMGYLDSAEDSENLLSMAPVFFTYKMLSTHGFRPQTKACVNCTKKLKGRLYFSPPLGGAICGQCTSKDETATPIDVKALSVLRAWDGQNTEEALASPLQDNLKKEVSLAVERFAQWHLHGGAV